MEIGDSFGPMNLPALRTDLVETQIAQPDAAAVEQLGARGTREAAENFAGILLGSLIKEMWKTISIDGKEPLSEGPGGSIYQSMAQNALSEALARNGMEQLTDRIQQALERNRATGSETPS